MKHQRDSDQDRVNIKRLEDNGYEKSNNNVNLYVIEE